MLADQGPVLLLRSGAVASRLANGNAAHLKTVLLLVKRLATASGRSSNTVLNSRVAGNVMGFSLITVTS